MAAHFTSAVLESTKSLIRACLLPRPASPPPAVLEGGQTKASSCPTSDVTCNGPAPDMAPQLRQACLDTSYGLQSEERNVYKINIRISAQLLIQVLHIWFCPPTMCHSCPAIMQTVAWREAIFAAENEYHMKSAGARGAELLVKSMQVD